MSTTQTKSRIGVNAVEAVFLKEFDWIFREQPIGDFGIDAHIEVKEDERPTGKLIALQIKSGISYFEKSNDEYVFRGDLRHLDYWTRHSLPVFLILHNPDTGLILWQKIERHLAKVSDKGWSISISETNILNKASKQYFAEGIADDPESIRRFNFAIDLDIMRLFEHREVYFEVNEWVNKSLNFRDVGVLFDEYGKEKPDFTISNWVSRQTLSDFMQDIFPWLDYDEMESDESMDAEVEVHTIQVRLNDLGRKYIAVEDYFKNGTPEPEGY
jgi:hypothetical protein